MSRFKTSLGYIFVCALVLVGALVAGITDYITADFDPTVFKTSSFWVNIVTTNIGTLCIIVAILIHAITKFKLTDPEYLTACDNINKFYNTSYQATIFGSFCHGVNKKIKCDTYKDKIHKKYSKLKPSLKDLTIYNGNDEKAKSENKYCRKVKYYGMLLSEDYINANLEKIKIKYNGISDSLVFSGCVTDSSKKNYITKNKFGKVFKDLLPRYILSFGITLIVASVIPDTKDGITLATIFKTCSKLFTMSTQIYFAINYASDYCQTVVLHDIRFRWSVITDYNMWYLSKTQQKEHKECEE